MQTPRRRRRFGSNPFELGTRGSYDDVADAERLRDEILPRMERIGLRKPANVAYA